MTGLGITVFELMVVLFSWVGMVALAIWVMGLLFPAVKEKKGEGELFLVGGPGTGDRRPETGDEEGFFRQDRGPETGDRGEEGVFRQDRG